MLPLPFLPMELDAANPATQPPNTKCFAAQQKITQFHHELNNLVKYFKHLPSLNTRHQPAKGNSLIACLLEESHLPLSKLVDQIFHKLQATGAHDTISKASVKSTVLMIAHRSCYGVKTEEADVLEDHDDSALWCWETRDLKLIPKSARASLELRRSCRRKINERIKAVIAMINALEKIDNDSNSQQELVKASEKLDKVLNEADIRLLMERMSCKNVAKMGEKEAKREEKILTKQMEKKRKKMDRETHREILLSEKELKRLNGEAEKEVRRREKEEIEIQKRLKKQLDEAEKDKKRREKEEAELKKRLAIQKQASLMECFLKRTKTNSSSHKESFLNKATTAGSYSYMLTKKPESVTVQMDLVLVQKDEINMQDIWKSHISAWRSSRSVHSNRMQHWGIRQNPKTELIKELKLTSNKKLTREDDVNTKKRVGLEDSNSDSFLSQMSTDNSPLPCSEKRVRVKQLLQFDKSYRPPFYGIWPRKSQVVGARRPLVKDSDIDYEINSDDEWEEEEPGESLSDCDKDDDDDDEERNLNDDNEDESEDGFLVPDGYLSENEGTISDGVECPDLVLEVRDPSISEKNEEFCTMLRQQKYLNSVTEHALKRNLPLIILNLTHEKTTLMSAEELTGTAKLERMALQTLSLRPLCGHLGIEISVPGDVVDEDEASSNKLSATPLATGAAFLDSDLPQIISIILSSPHSIGKIEESLQIKYPAVPRSRLRNKVREISNFSDNRWQVKKEILSKYEKSCLKKKGIAAFLKTGETKNTSKAASQTARVESPQDH